MMMLCESIRCEISNLGQKVINIQLDTFKKIAHSLTPPSQQGTSWWDTQSVDPCTVKPTRIVPPRRRSYSGWRELRMGKLTKHCQQIMNDDQLQGDIAACMGLPHLEPKERKLPVIALKVKRERMILDR